MWSPPEAVALTDDVVHHFPSDEVVEERALDRVEAGELWRAVGELPPLMRDVTFLRFGLAGTTPRSCRETGVCLGTTHPTVRKAERDALALLRGRFAA